MDEMADALLRERRAQERQTARLVMQRLEMRGAGGAARAQPVVRNNSGRYTASGYAAYMRCDVDACEGDKGCAP